MKSDFPVIFSMMLKSSGFALSFGNNSAKAKKTKSGKLKFKNQSLFKYASILTLIFTALFVAMNVLLAETLKSDLKGIVDLPNITFYDFFYQNFATNIVFTFFAFSFSAIFSCFFLANDNEHYLHFPIKPKTLYLSKFCISVLNGCLLPLSAPLSLAISSWIYFDKSQVPQIASCFLYYIGISAGLLGIIFLFGMFLSEVCRLKKHRNVMVGINFAIMIIGILFYSIFSRTSTGSGSTTTTSSPLDFIATPLKQSPTNCITIVSLITCVGLIISTLAYIIGRFTYIKAITGTSDTGGRKKKKLSEAELDNILNKKVHHQNELLQQVKREILTIVKSPAYFFNYMLPVIMLVAMSAIVSISTLTSLKEMDIDFFTLLLSAIAFIMTNMSLLECTTIYSKDRMDSYYLYSTPINQKKVLLAKTTLFPVPISLINIILGIIITVCFAQNVRLEMVLVVIAAAILPFGIAFLSAIIDLGLGRINVGATEMQIVKFSKSAIIGMLNVFLVPMIIFVPIFVAMNYVGEKLIILFPILTLSMTLIYTITTGVVLFTTHKKRLHKFMCRTDI